MNFNQWLDTFIEEKDFDTERLFAVEGKSGINFIPLGCVIEAIKFAPKNEREQIKDMIVKIDLCAPDKVLGYFEYLAKAIAM